MEPTDPTEPYFVVMKDGLGELIQEVNRRLRTKNWKTIGGVAITERVIHEGSSNQERKVIYLQAMLLKTFEG
jgi:hypothetical protein